MTKEKVLEAIKALSVVELAELVKALEEEFGVTAAAPAAQLVAAVPPGAAAGATPAGPVAEEEEKTEWSVVLTDAGENKINVIKAVREVTTLGLREAKDLVEGAPKPVQEATTKEEAQQIKEKLEAAGAKVTVE